ncbi:hypothetical protein DPMN_141673 [Dreissena polymorpha]|uniref:Uncharacterized protein n=1 Tax=Dreissena polymorpha TaxID=45954 RepID=A0A9D4GD49_DREPO|nr:hypothetical protein DPMN_141673 [Dreissena polymorpha]
MPRSTWAPGVHPLGFDNSRDYRKLKLEEKTKRQQQQNKSRKIKSTRREHKNMNVKQNIGADKRYFLTTLPTKAMGQ